MTYEKWGEQLDALRDLLAARLPYNRTWNNVAIITKKTQLRIRWFDAKNSEIYDPEGEIEFKETIISPLTKSNIMDEIEKQKGKLELDREKYNASKSIMG